MHIIEQILKSTLETLENIFVTIFDFLAELITGIPEKNQQYKAEFVSTGSLLSSWNHGFSLTGHKNLTAKQSYQNALIIGGTGVGKSSVVLIPSLYTMRSSFIIHDPSGELFSKTGGYLQQKGYEVKLLNFTNPAISSGYNPLSRIQTTSDIQKISSMLVENALGGKNKDPFWSTQAVSLISILITILKKQEPEAQNLFNVRQLLNLLGSDPEQVDALFSKDAHEVLFAEYKSFIAYDEKVVAGIIATCKAALQIFSDDAVARVTSFDTLNMQDFRGRLVALYIQNSVADQKYYSVLTSIFFEQFFSYILSRFPNDGEQDIFLLIDEASSLNLPTLPLAVANVRKHRAGIMLLVQDFNQLVHHYGKFDSDAIKSNCITKMYFTGQSLETTKELESILGKYEFVDDEGKKVIRSLMTNDEIRKMDTGRALIICGNHPPIMARLRPYYKTIQYRNYSKIPCQIENTVTVDPRTTLPIMSRKNKLNA